MCTTEAQEEASRRCRSIVVEPLEAGDFSPYRWAMTSRCAVSSPQAQKVSGSRASHEPSVLGTRRLHATGLTRRNERKVARRQAVQCNCVI